MERRLAAILAADVVGYSKLVQADEAMTLRRLKAIWAEVFETNVTGHRGRIFKMMGDGALAEFASVVDAVECGVAIQQALRARKTGGEDGPPIDFRIGRGERRRPAGGRGALGWRADFGPCSQPGPGQDRRQLH
jgi:adenylate cyclase